MSLHEEAYPLNMWDQFDTKLLILRDRLDIKKPPPKWKKTI